MKISKHTREEAAIALSKMASDRAINGNGLFGYFEIDGLSPAARKLAVCAHNRTLLAADEWGRPQYHIEYAEAEAMLRTGWEP